MRLAPVVVAAALLAVPAFASPEEPVLRVPREGDAARYVATVENLRSGAVVSTVTLEWTESWTIGRVRLPGAPETSYATLSGGPPSTAVRLPLFPFRADARLPEWNRPPNWGFEGPILSEGSASHYAEIPGPRLARTTSIVQQVDVRGHAAPERSFRWSTVERDADPCAEPSGFLAGARAPDAEAALLRCAGTDAVVRSGFERDPRFGDVWVARVADRGRDVVVKTVPSLPFVLSAEGSSSSRAGEVRWSVSLEGFAEGSGTLPESAAPPPGPVVPLVLWGPGGPAEGDLEREPFADSYAAIARSDTPSRYFREHPASVLLQAFYSEWPTEGGTPYFYATFPQCDGALPEASATKMRHWGARWSDASSGLVAYAESYARTDLAADPTPPLRAGGFLIAGSADADDAKPKRFAPSPATLASLASEVERVGGAGNLAFSANPALRDRPQDVAGSVGLRTCVWQGDSERFAFREVGLLVRDGRIAARYEVEDGVGSVLQAVATEVLPNAPVSAAAPEPEDPGLPLLPLLVVGGLVIPLLMLAPSLYSRFSPRDVLQNPKRLKIFEAARAAPGSTIPELVASLGFHRAVVAHHLRFLEANGMVTLVRTARGIAVHLAGDPRAKAARALARRHADRVLAVVLASPGSTLGEIAERTGLAKSRVSVLARELEAAGLVRRRADVTRLRLDPA